MPTAPRVAAEQRLPGRLFGRRRRAARPTARWPLSYYKPATASHTYQAEHAGRYQLVVDLTANETFVDGQFDYNKCRLMFKADGKVLHDQEFTRQGGKPYRYEFDEDWKAGDHELTFELEPLTQGAAGPVADAADRRP